MDVLKATRSRDAVDRFAVPMPLRCSGAAWLGVAFGPRPQSATVLAWSAMIGWLFFTRAGGATRTERRPEVSHTLMVGPGEHAVWCQLEVAETLPVWLREMLSSSGSERPTPQR